MANSVDPDQTAPSGTIWSGSALFAYAIVSEALRYEILGHLLYLCEQNTYKNFIFHFSTGAMCYHKIRAPDNNFFFQVNFCTHSLSLHDNMLCNYLEISHWCNSNPYHLFFHRLRHVSKVNKCPHHPLVFAHMATTSGCINFNNYFPNAQSDLLYILTPHPTSWHDPGETLAQN